MIIKALKAERLHLNLEFLDDEGKLTKRKQQLDFMAQDATDDEKHAMGVLVGSILISVPKSIDNTFIYELVEG